MNRESQFLEKYIDTMTKTMLRINPTWNKKDIKKVIEKTIKERIQNPEVVIDNNYTGEEKNTSLLSVIDWCMKRKPLIAGNGTFYKNQHEALNPIRLMLDEWADNRKQFKKQMFEAGEIYGVNSRQYKDKDRNQANEKINMNSYYGGSGAKTSAFYSKWSGPATTLTAQSVISTAEQAFEATLADNYSFINLTELFEWIRCVEKEYKEEELDLSLEAVSGEKLLERLLDRILIQEENDEEILRNYIMNLSNEKISFLYYKNNFLEFIHDHEEIQDIFQRIMENVKNLPIINEDAKDWTEYLPEEYMEEFESSSPKKWNKFVNKEMFIDPNSPPSSVLSELNQLSHYVNTYVYVKYLSFDRIYRLKNFKRDVVTVIDTDSNFLSLDSCINYLFGNVVDIHGYGRDEKHNEFILVNTITFLITNIIKTQLRIYGEHSNIPEEYLDRFDMKNEFFNDLLIIGEKKKRYITKQQLREGNIISPAKIDIKGFDFKKASTSEYAESVFNQLIRDYIIYADRIDVKKLIDGLRRFKEEIIQSIKNGEQRFLPNGNAKELGAYMDPGREQSVRGAIAWNLLYPDNQIEFPAKVSLLKMNIFTESDMIDLEKENPDIYHKIIKGIFQDTTGIFVTETKVEPITYINIKKKEWWNDIPRKYRTKFKKLGAEAWNRWVDDVMDKKVKIDPRELEGYYEYKKKGLQVLAIPSNAKIPEWTMPYIDFDTMVNTIIAPFKPVLEIFNAKFPEVGKTKNGVNRKTASLSNIVKF